MAHRGYAHRVAIYIALPAANTRYDIAALDIDARLEDHRDGCVLRLFEYARLDLRFPDTDAGGAASETWIEYGRGFAAANWEQQINLISIIIIIIFYFFLFLLIKLTTLEIVQI